LRHLILEVTVVLQVINMPPQLPSDESDAEEPLQKKAKSTRTWDEGFCKMVMHAAGCAVCKGFTPQNCLHECSICKHSPGPTNKDRRKTIREQLHKGVLSFEHGHLLYKNKQVVLDDQDVTQKLQELHAPAGNESHRKEIRRDFNLRFHAPNSNVRELSSKLIDNCLHCIEQGQTGPQLKVRKHIRPVRAMRPRERGQADLIDIGKGRASLQLKGFRYVLTIIYCFTKKSWAYLLKRKEKTEVAEIMRAHFKEYGAFRILQTDNGGEFTNSQLEDVVEEIGMRATQGRP